MAGWGGQIDAAALVFVRAALLDRVVMTSDVDTAAGGADDLQSDNMPVVALHGNSARSLFEFLCGEVKERPSRISSFDSNWRFGGAAGAQPHGLIQFISSSGNADDIVGLGPLHGFRKTAKWLRGSSGGAGLAG